MVNPISAISDFLSGAATRVFDGIQKFLLEISTFGLNAVEIVLFVLFIALVIAIIAAPIKIYVYLKEFTQFWSKILRWLKN